MEYIRGIKPTDAQAVRSAGLDPGTLAQRGVDFVLRQVLEFGFFQADPHPGNFFVMAGNVLAPVDFGQVATLGQAERALMGEFLQSILETDPARLVRAFERLDMMDDRCNVAELQRDLGELLGMYRDLPVKEMPFGAMVRQTFELFRRHRLRPPAEFTLMLKAMMTVESMAVSLDSDFRLVDRLPPYVRRLQLAQASPRRMWRRTRQTLFDALSLAGDLPAELRAILRNVKRGRVMVHVHHEHLENLVRTVDKSSDRLSFALIIAGLLVGSSLLVGQKDNTLLGLVQLQTLGALGYLVAAVLGLGLLISIFRRRKG
jgi:ubiquinone biosynthesis protein